MQEAKGVVLVVRRAPIPPPAQLGFLHRKSLEHSWETAAGRSPAVVSYACRWATTISGHAPEDPPAYTVEVETGPGVVYGFTKTGLPFL
jgi:hypothetical protein